MAIAVGDMLPQAKFKVLTSEGLGELTTKEITDGRKIVIFAVPGAFTPTCNAKHLPGFVNQAEAIKAKGIGEIYCVAVNDAFVLGAWGEANGVAGKVTLLSDGNGEFTKALDLGFDGSMAGLGTRSRRYAMIVESGKVRWLAVEETPPMLEVSGAEQVLSAL